MNLKNKRLCRILCGCIVGLLLVCFLPVSASAEQAYPSYTYNSREQAVPTALPYEVTKVFGAKELGLDDFSSPGDIYVAGTGEIFVLDTDNSRVVVMNSDYSFNRVIIPKNEEGEQLSLNSGTGIYVHTDGRIVIAGKSGFSSSGSKVFIFDAEGTPLQFIEKPEASIIDDKFDYRPAKAEIDSGGILYVLTANSANGAMQFDAKGEFMGFYGGEDVDVTFEILWRSFWRDVLSNEANEGIERTVSVEFISFCIDHKDFVFTIRRGGETITGQVRKLNAKGDNVLDETKRFGDHITDIQLKDLAVDDEGFITLIDGKSGRIMQYDADGEMLYAFGGKKFGTDQAGTFDSPTSVETNGRDILVLDRQTGLITVFSPTDFALNVREATLLYRDGKYEDAKTPWQKVLTCDNNYELANVGMGKIYEGLGEYEIAMDYYQKGNNKAFYSEAFEKHRSDLLREYFWLLMIVVVAIFVGPFVLLSKKPAAKEAYAGGRPKGKYPFYCMLHPINGYQDLKDEKAGSIWRANCILAALFVVSILAHQLTGFSFNMNRVEQLNVWVSLCSTVGVFVAAVVCNWAVTTIMDGKGKLLEIWVFCAYALLPYVILSAVAIVCSNLLTIDESAFYTAVQWIGYGWTALTLVIALREVHQYSLTKTIVTIVITFFGLMIVVVVVAIVYSVFSQLIGFITTLWSEIMMRT